MEELLEQSLVTRGRRWKLQSCLGFGDEWKIQWKGGCLTSYKSKYKELGDIFLWLTCKTLQVGLALNSHLKLWIKLCEGNKSSQSGHLFIISLLKLIHLQIAWVRTCHCISGMPSSFDVMITLTTAMVLRMWSKISFEDSACGSSSFLSPLSKKIFSLNNLECWPSECWRHTAWGS